MILYQVAKLLEEQTQLSERILEAAGNTMLLKKRRELVKRKLIKQIMFMVSKPKPYFNKASSPPAVGKEFSKSAYRLPIQLPLKKGRHRPLNVKKVE